LPSKVAKIEKEKHNSHLIYDVWSTVIGLIRTLPDDTKADELDKIQGLGTVELQVLFVCRSRALYRSIDAVDQSLVTISAFTKGYGEGFEVAQPQRPFPMLRCLHRVRKKKKVSLQSGLSDFAKQK